MEAHIFLVIVYIAILAKMIKEKKILKGSQQKELLNVSLS